MDTHAITTVDGLRALYREPSERVKAKKGAALVGEAARFIEAAPFFLLATSSPDGACDVSPRGGPAGQLVVLDEGRLAFPDLSGNNLLDSLTNIVENPRAGLLVVCPGSDETVRVDGRAHLTADPEILALWDSELRRPKVAVVIDVEAVFLHCGKAFIRSGMWQPDTWAESPDVCQAFNDIVGDQSVAPEEMRGFLDADYDETLTEERKVN